MNRNLLIDKYRPTSLEELDFNNDANNFLLALAKSHSTNTPHLILEGCRGSGKRLRVELFLKARFGDFRTKKTDLQFDIPGKTEKHIHTLTSPYHYQFNPNIHSTYDRTLIQVFINEILHYKLITGVPYKIIVIEDADLLSTEAQESLRRTLETCVSTCRFIFLVNKEDRLIAPLYSRCIKVKLSCPTIEEITNILGHINETEGFGFDKETLISIARNSDRDLTRAIHYLGKRVYDDKEEFDNVRVYCNDIIENLFTCTRIEDIEKKVRKQLYELVNYCVDCRVLIKELMTSALARIPKSEHDAIFELCKIASKRDISIRSSSKAVYHVESFCLHLFGIIKKILDSRKKPVAPKVIPKVQKKAT